MRNICVILSAVGLGLGWAGCRSQPPSHESMMAMPPAFSRSGTEVLPEKWWQSFHDSVLNDLVEEALSGNFDLKGAWDRLVQAEQVAVKAGAPLLPSVTYQVNAARQRTETGSTTTYNNTVSAGLVASYEVDVWNRVRAGRQAALADVDARQQDLAAAAVTLSVSVAKTWYQLVEVKQQVQLIHDQVERNQNILDIVTTQFRKGQATAADVFRQRQLVESTRGVLIQTQEQDKLLQYRLCVLLGRTPELAWATQDEGPLVDLPDLPDTGVPAQVIQRRPDVASAFAAVQAADYRVAAAISDQYPSLNLTATFNTSESRVEDLFDDWLAKIMAEVAGPLFDANVRRAEAERTRALLSQAIHTYQQTVVESLQEVEDALVQETHQRAYLASLTTQLDLAGKTYERTRQRYVNGQLDYLRVLESLESQQQLERSTLSGKRTLIERRIDLCRALAGSWDLDRPENAGGEPVSPTHSTSKVSL